MITVDQALEQVLALARPMGPETVALRHAAGRVLAADAHAALNQPPFNASAMDGYAVAGDAPPGAVFRVIGSAQAGRAHPGPVGQGEAVRIFTGAPVPEGADRVVIQEDVTLAGDLITVGPSPDSARHIRPLGRDFARGDTLVAPRRLRPADLALLAAMNVPRLTVARRPVVAIIPTGDELVMPGDTPGPDQIVASNIFAIAALAEAEGAEARLLPIARDSAEALGDVLDLAAGADLVITIGGASVGDHDLVASVAEARGMRRAFWKIAMRPGKPLMAGRLADGAAMLGLPGNPVSAIVCTHLFVLPFLRACLGLADPGPPVARARLGADLGANGVRAHYMRATLAPGADLPVIMPVSDQDSARLRLLSDAQALLIRPVGDGPRKAGEVVDFIAL